TQAHRWRTRRRRRSRSRSPPRVEVKDLVEFLCRELVDDPDAVRVDEALDDRGSVYTVHVGPGELGKVIGRGGRTATAIRTVVRAAATRQHVSVRVDFED